MTDASLLENEIELSSAARALMTTKQRRLVELNDRLRQEPPTVRDAAFLHAVLCQVSLPRSRVDGREFKRVSGGAELIVQAGYIERRGKLVPAPVPFGVRPRLILIHVATQAVRTGTRRIDVGRSIHDFMGTLGVGGNGREYRAFREQLEALAACRLILGACYGERDETDYLQPFKRHKAWLSNDDQRGIWPGEIELTADFFESLQGFSVPLASGALAELKGSSLALDIYTWLAHRLWRVAKPTKVSWAALREQFGQEYRPGETGARNFKRTFRVALRQALTAYPEARIDEDTVGGIILLPSRPPVPRTQVQAAMPCPG